jgi:hypothetical protein
MFVRRRRGRVFLPLFLLATTLTCHRRAPGGSAVLTRRRQEFTTLHERSRGVIDAAAGANDGAGRDLTESELAAVTADRERAATLAAEIETLVEDELRAARVAAGYADIGAPAEQQNAGTGETEDEHERSEHDTSGTSAQDRDPGHYRSVAEGGENSFFADLVRAREGDGEAATRLQEHNRALSTQVGGAGIVPPRWLIEEYEALARQGRVAAELVRRIEITNPAPMTLQRQTAGTDNVLARQATENTHPSETDAFGTTVDVVTPKPISGIQVVSRQMIDMTNPAADNLIYGDMLSVYNRKIEDSVTAALVTAAGTPTSPMATETAFTPVPPANPPEDAITDCAIAVWNGRKLPADVVLMRTSRWGKFMKMRDTGGRRLYPAEGEMVNISGRGSVRVPGSVGGLAVGVTDGLGIGIGSAAPAGYPESIVVFRSADTILFEGNMLRFRYEEVAGPESVKLGVWAYSAVIVRYATTSVRRTEITIA